MSTYVIACGGTGGHLAPGIALAEALRGRGHRCLLIISRKRVDARLGEQYPELEFVRSPGSPLSLRPMRLAAFLYGQARAFLFALRLFRREKPEAAAAFGGFTTLGAALAGRFFGCPLALHEANHRPGKATRLLGRTADRVYLPHGMMLPGIHPRQVRYPGYPLRRSVRRIPRQEARRKLGLPPGGRLLAVIGGSQGAAALNEWARKYAELLCAFGINLCCVTGAGKGPEGDFEYSSHPGGTAHARFISFTHQMGELLSAADLAVSRAGAGAIAELTCCQTPSILVPYPHAADNHQMANARFFEQQGGCVTVGQHRIKDLFNEVNEMIFNDWLLNRFRQNLQNLKREDGAEVMAEDLEKLRVEYARGRAERKLIFA